MTFGDYVVTEAGFGADLGAEKFYNIKCRKSGLQPKLTIIVATAQGLKMHGGVSLDRIKEPNMEGLKEGFGNLDKHVRNLRSFGQQVIVAFNRFASDTDEEVEAIRRHCEEKLEVGFAVNNAFAKGGEGAVDLANLVVDTIENKPSEPLTFTYEESDCVERKIEKVACNLYGASVVTYSLHSRKVIKLIEQMGISHYPVCIAKTQYSFSADPKIYGAVNNFEFHIKDIVVNEYCSREILRYSNMINRKDVSNYSVAELIEFLIHSDEEICFSDYATKFINRMASEGHERNAKNYRLAVNHLERYLGTTRVMFTHLSSSVLTRWINSLSLTNRAKEMYPTCLRQIFKRVTIELNDEERGIVRINTIHVKVSIPKSDSTVQRAISAEACREFFNRPYRKQK